MMTENRLDSKSLRRFGLAAGLGFAGLALISRYRGHASIPLVLLIPAAALLILALAMPRLLVPVEKGFKAFGTILGWVNTRIILTCLFVIVVSPIGLIMKVFRDPLGRRKEPGKSTYWQARSETSPLPPSPESRFQRYERQF
jgi:hypothetical protein